MSLREIKKRETILRVQDAAYRLAAEHGYDGTTVEAIAAASGVSPSTIYRTFGTKEGIFLWDELEIPTIEALEAELSWGDPVEAVVAVVEAIGEAEFHVPVDVVRERWQFVMAEPALRCAFREAFARFTGIVVEMLVSRRGVDAVEARIIAGAQTAAIEALTTAWVTADPPVDLATAASGAARSLRAVLNG